VPERRHAKLTPGKSLRIVRELQGLSQAGLADLSGVPQPTISAIENGRKGMGVERARQLADALLVHPSVLAFPDWEPRADIVDLFSHLKKRFAAEQVERNEQDRDRRRRRHG